MDTKSVAVWTNWLRTRALGVPVWIKIFGIGVGLILLLSGQMIWHVRNTCRVTMEQELTRQTHALLVDVPTLAPEVFSTPAKSDTQRLLTGLFERHPELVSLDVLDANGAVIAHTSTARFPRQDSLIELMVPSRAGQLSGLRTTVSTRMIRTHLDQLTGQMLLIAILLALVGLGAAWALTRIIVRPIRELVRATTEVRHGNLRVRARPYANDELGQLTNAFNEMTQALEEKEAIRTHLIQRVLSAQEEERARVSKELHDELGQSLTSIMLGLKNLEARVTERCASLCSELREMAGRTLEAAHDLAMALRPSALRDLGLLAALEHYVASCRQRFGIKMDLAVIGFDGLERLPEPLEVALYRIVQEAVTNSVKHGSATSINVVLQRREGSIIATIEDDGSGFDSANWRLRVLEQKRLGLLGMEERARALDGVLTVESRPHGGTTIYVELPLAVSTPMLVAA